MSHLDLARKLKDNFSDVSDISEIADQTFCDIAREEGHHKLVEIFGNAYRPALKV